MSDLEGEINERAVLGHNLPDYGKAMTEKLSELYKEPLAQAEALLIEARDIYALGDIADEDEALAGRVASFAKRIRDHAKNLLSHHAKEKYPPKTEAEACDTLFFGVVDKMARRNKKNKPGAYDLLFARYDNWNQRKLRREQLERERIAREAAEEEARKTRAAEEAKRVEEEARLAHERARAPAQIEKKAEIAQEAGVAADSAAVDAIIATDTADAADLATRAKPADIVRTRFEGGTTGTMQTEKFAEIVDRKLLDKEELWPHLKQEWLQTALNSWAAANGHDKQMTGAKIGKRPKSRIK